MTVFFSFASEHPWIALGLAAIVAWVIISCVTVTVGSVTACILPKSEGEHHD